MLRSSQEPAQLAFGHRQATHFFYDHGHVVAGRGIVFVPDGPFMPLADFRQPLENGKGARVVPTSIGFEAILEELLGLLLIRLEVLVLL